MRKAYDVIIIGAGIIGNSIAFDLAKRGYRTLNIDKQPAAGYGSTANSSAVIRTHYSTRQGTALAYESLFHWQNWREFLAADDELGFACYRETGIVDIKKDVAGYDKFREHHNALGIAYEDWDRAELERRMPYLDLQSFGPPKRPEDPEFGTPSGDYISGAFFVPAGGYINDPVLAAHNLQRAAEKKGASFLFKNSVTEIRQNGGRVNGVTLESGSRIDAPIVVNVAGPHSFVINEMAGVAKKMKIRTRPLRQEAHYTPAPTEVEYDKVGTLISDNDVGGYSRPEVGGKLVVGSLEPACDALEWVNDPDDFDRDVSGEQWEAQVYRVALRIPSLAIPTHPLGVVDLYDVSDDWIPVYDKSDLPGFYMAVGTSGNQFKSSPVVGQMMGKLINDCEEGHDHDESPVSITGRYTGEILDLGFYSRLRDSNTDSSFSVLG